MLIKCIFKFFLYNYSVHLHPKSNWRVCLQKLFLFISSQFTFLYLLNTESIKLMLFQNYESCFYKMCPWTMYCIRIGSLHVFYLNTRCHYMIKRYPLGTETSAQLSCSCNLSNASDLIWSYLFIFLIKITQDVFKEVLLLNVKSFHTPLGWKNWA